MNSIVRGLLLVAATANLAACTSTTTTSGRSSNASRPTSSSAALVEHVVCGGSVLSVTNLMWSPSPSTFYTRAVDARVTLANVGSTPCAVALPSSVTVTGEPGSTTLRAVPLSGTTSGHMTAAPGSVLTLSLHAWWPSEGSCNTPISNVGRVEIELGSGLLTLPVQIDPKDATWAKACGGTQSVSLRLSAD